jgi:hypothetical protein
LQIRVAKKGGFSLFSVGDERETGPEALRESSSGRKPAVRPPLEIKPRQGTPAWAAEFLPQIALVVFHPATARKLNAFLLEGLPSMMLLLAAPGLICVFQLSFGGRLNEGAGNSPNRKSLPYSFHEAFFRRHLRRSLLSAH